MLTALLKAWAAGVFDGEGSATIASRKNGYYQIFVSVGGTERSLANVFTENWGAVFHGEGRHTVCRDGSRGKDNYDVWFEGDNAIWFLVDVIPYLRLKQDQAVIVLGALYALKRAHKDPARKELHTGKGRVGYSDILKPYYETLQAEYPATKGKKRTKPTSS